MLFAELLAQLLRPVYGQAVVCPVPWVKADDIVVAFHIFPFLIFPKFVLISTNLYFLAPYDKADTHNNTNKQTVLIPLLFLESQHPSRGGNYRPSLVRQ